MKTLNQYIKEKLIINKDYRGVNMVPKSFDELRKIIEDRYDKLGPGTEQNPIDFNDIDVSNIIYFDNNKGIFEGTKFKYIDITCWDVSNAKSMHRMFSMCKELESIGDLLKWNVSNVTDMSYMFYMCRSLKQNLSSLDVSNVANMSYAFFFCESFNQDISSWNVSSVNNMNSMFAYCKIFNQDISDWDVSNVENMTEMFYYCKNFNKDISDWDVSNVMYKKGIFDNCPIKDEYKPKFK